MPSLLTPEIAAEVTRRVMDGASITDAAAANGINRVSIFRWQRRGREALRARELGEQPAPEDEPFIAFAEQLAQARAQAKVEAISIIRRAAIGVPEEEVVETYDGTVLVKRVVHKRTRVHWAAAAWWLERRYRQEFGRYQRVELTGEDGAPIDAEERAKRLAAEVEAYAAGAADAAAVAAEPAER